MRDDSTDSPTSRSRRRSTGMFASFIRNARRERADRRRPPELGGQLTRSIPRSTSSMSAASPRSWPRIWSKRSGAGRAVPPQSALNQNVIALERNEDHFVSSPRPTAFRPRDSDRGGHWRVLSEASAAGVALNRGTAGNLRPRVGPEDSAIKAARHQSARRRSAFDWAQQIRSRAKAVTLVTGATNTAHTGLRRGCPGRSHGRTNHTATVPRAGGRPVPGRGLTG